MADLDLRFVNAALTRTGNDPIAALNDGSTAGGIAGTNYELMRSAALTGYPWRWATKTKTLVMLEETPDLPWLYAYQLPTDMFHLRVITVDGLPIDYEMQSANKLLCNYDNTVDVVAKYTWDVPESYWPPDFGEAIIQMLEPLFLRGIGERYEEADARTRDAARTMQAAKTADAKRASPRDPWRSPTLEARNGAVTRAPLPWR